MILAFSLTASTWAQSPEEPSLKDEIKSYFTESDAEKRDQIAARIEKRPDANVEAVKTEIAAVPLWSDVPPGKTQFSFQGTDGHPTEVSAWVPKDYSPDRTWPVIVALHWMDGKAEEFIDYVRKLLGTHADEFLIVAPQSYRGFLFQSPLPAAEDPNRLMREVRHRFRIDSGRIYVIGYSLGGHSAFSAAAFNRDLFTGSVVIAGTFAASVYEQERTLFLPNVADFPMLVAWGADDQGDGRGATDPHGGIAGSNRRLKALMADQYPRITMLEQPGVGHIGVMPDEENLIKLLTTVRKEPSKTISYWFRYPIQGRRDWLRVHEFSGDPWEGTVLKIQVKPGEDPADHVINTLKRLLAFLGGKVEGQRIDIETRHLKSVEVLFFDGLVDLNQPIEIHLNGKKSFEQVVKPDVGSVLEFAYNEWEFQCLPLAQLVLTRTGQVEE